MEANDPVLVAQILVEQEMERVRAASAAKFIRQFQVGIITLEELTYKLLEIVEENP